MGGRRWKNKTNKLHSSKKDTQWMLEYAAITDVATLPI